MYIRSSRTQKNGLPTWTDCEQIECKIWWEFGKGHSKCCNAFINLYSPAFSMSFYSNSLMNIYYPYIHKAMNLLFPSDLLSATLNSLKFNKTLARGFQVKMQSPSPGPESGSGWLKYAHVTRLWKSNFPEYTEQGLKANRLTSSKLLVARIFDSSVPVQGDLTLCIRHVYTEIVNSFLGVQSEIQGVLLVQ